jgi:hypothetical protein
VPHLPEAEGDRQGRRRERSNPLQGPRKRWGRARFAQSGLEAIPVCGSYRGGLPSGHAAGSRDEPDTIGSDGAQVYVAAAACGALLEISPRGVVKTLLRTSAPWSPTAVAVHDGSVYVLEYLHTASDNRSEWLPRVRKIARDGTVSTIAAISGR